MTIKELADTLGVSKTAIRKYMTAEFRAEYTATNRNGVITIDSTGCKLIAESMGKLRKYLETVVPEECEQSETPQESALLTAEIAFLKEQLTAKDRQIDSLQLQITQLTTALENTTAGLRDAQALHAGTLQQQLLEAPKKKWKLPWKKN